MISMILLLYDIGSWELQPVFKRKMQTIAARNVKVVCFFMRERFFLNPEFQSYFETEASAKNWEL
ncbi:hypothetical protein CH370_03855 [Leptospira kmetyi]|uniref:Uncharacterized protein n=1 Tax=Leptospira kmetyi TaxID=408139 RepID=A0ABX4N4N1_9LEPT|nr:hypothetical protein CH378_20730 [Leptospira kmetyi]PJZ42373.1 hypothetical protein CH370_03855 [Leptospira kmetyi]